MNLRSLWNSVRRAPLPAKLAAGGLAGALLLGGRAALADAPAAPSMLGPQIGDAHARLAAGDRVRLPGAFHLRATPTASSAGAREYAAQVVTIEAAAPTMRRGPRETGYRVALADGRVGYVFVPFDATRA